MPAERIRRLAHELAETERAVVYGRIGLCNQEFGTLASWAVDVVNVLTGHLDVHRRRDVPDAGDRHHLARPRAGAAAVRSGRWHTRVREAPEVLGQAPISCLAEEIATPGEGRCVALIVMAGNPALSAPDAGRLEAALPMLEAMISVDNWMNETSRHAHVILPGLSALEQPHCDEALWGFAVRSAARWSPAIFPRDDRPAGVGDPHSAGGDPGRHSRGRRSTSRPSTTCSSPNAPHATGSPPADVMDKTALRGPDRIADLTVRMTPWGDGYGARPGGLTLESLKNDYPHGVDFGPMVPRIDSILRTASGRCRTGP